MKLEMVSTPQEILEFDKEIGPNELAGNDILNSVLVKSANAIGLISNSDFVKKAAVLWGVFNQPHNQVHMHLHTYIHIHLNAFTYIYIHTFSYTVIHTHPHTHIFIHIHTHTHTHTGPVRDRRSGGRQNSPEKRGSRSIAPVR
jgi:hypothetical protein